jgi:HK97 family phage major capsid protein
MTVQRTTDTAFGFHPDEVTFAPDDVVPAALVLQTSTVSGEVDGDQPALHVAFVTDAGQTGDGAKYVAEGATIDDEEAGLDEVLVHTKKIARLATLSNEQFRQAPTAGRVAASFARDLIRKADASFLGDAANPTGLLHATGITDAPAPVDGSLDVLVDLLAELEVQGATPSAIVLDPLSWAAFRKLKVAETYNESLLGAGTTDALPMLLSLPVLRSRFIPEHSGLVVDRTAIASAVGPVRVSQSEHAAFKADATVVKATWRIGWNLVRPERIGRFTVGDIAGS